MRCGLPYFDEEAHKVLCRDIVEKEMNETVELGEDNPTGAKLNKTLEERIITEQAVLSTIQILQKARAAREAREREKQ